MKLYYSPGACSLASHISLIESGKDFDTVKVDLSSHETEDGEDFYTISKRGYVPAIETDTGLLTENAAVLAYLAEWSGTAPSGRDYFKMLEWLGFIGSEIHSAYHPLFGGGDKDEKAEAKKALAKAYQLAVDIHEGGPWLVTDQPTGADNYMFVTTLWADKFDIDLPDAVVDFCARNKDRESVKQAMAAEGLG